MSSPGMSKPLEEAIHNKLPHIVHDVTLLVGPKMNPISGHKLILSIVSPVFDQMFRMGRPTGRGRQPSKYNLPDLDPVGVQNVVRYAYSRHLNVTVADAMVTMTAASKLEIPELSEHCANYLFQLDVNNENAIAVYQSFCHLSEPTDARSVILLQKKEKAFYWIVKNFDAIMNSTHFWELTDTNLRKFLKLDSLFVHSEVDVFRQFRAVIGWAGKKCVQKGWQPLSLNRRKVLTGVLNLIRFSTMDGDDFTTHVEPTNILDRAQCYDWYKHFSLSPSKRMKFHETAEIKYNFISRDGAILKQTICSVFHNSEPKIEHYKEHLNPIEASFSDELKITYATANVLKLKSVGVVVGYKSSETWKVKIKLELLKYEFRDDVAKGEVIAKITKTLTAESLKITYIAFEEPVRTQTNTLYKINVTILKGTLAVYPKEMCKPPLELDVPNASFNMNLNPHSTKPHAVWRLQFEYY